MQGWIATLIGAAVGLLTLLLTIFVQSRAAARIEGALGAMVQGHSESINKLDTAKDQQWSKLGEHGERIVALETKTSHL